MKISILLAMFGFGFCFSSVAQSGSDDLNQVAWMLSANRHTGQLFRGLGSKWQLARLDTIAVTGETMSQQAFYYLMQQNYEKGVALLEKSTQLDPKQHRNAGWTYMMTLRDYPRALRHLNAFDALTPDFDDTDGISPVSYLKGLCYRNMGNHAEAVRQFSKGIDSLAKKHGSEWVNYKHYVSRAISYLSLNQPDKALIDLDSALKNSTSESPLALYHRGKAYQQQGRTADAKRAFQDAQFFWQANRVKGISQPEDYNNPVTEGDIDEALKQ